MEKVRKAPCFYNDVSESAAMNMSKTAAWNDRKAFVSNLGVLLSQTREGIAKAELDEGEIVTVTYKNGYGIKVNVECDSYLAIIRDVCKHL